MLQRRPNTFAQTILSLSFFACGKAADHTFRLAPSPAHNPEHQRRANATDWQLVWSRDYITHCRTMVFVAGPVVYRCPSGSTYGGCVYAR